MVNIKKFYSYINESIDSEVDNVYKQSLNDKYWKTFSKNIRIITK